MPCSCEFGQVALSYSKQSSQKEGSSADSGNEVPIKERPPESSSSLRFLHFTRQDEDRPPGSGHPCRY